MAKILRVSFDASDSEAPAPAEQNLSDVTHVGLHSAALTLERWKDFDQVVFDLSEVGVDVKSSFCQQLIAGQSLMDQIPDGLVLLDSNGKILWANSR